MVSFQLIIALLSAGIALFAGSVSLFTGLHRNGEKTDLIFGVLCLAIFIYFLYPPIGFIVLDKAPYPTDVIIKRVFNFIFFSIFPWFVLFYTGYKKIVLPIIIDSINVLSYFIMLFSTKDNHAPLWVFTALIVICLSIIYGFIAVRYQFKNGDKASAKWFQSSMFVYLFLFVISTIYQTNVDFFFRILHTKIFFPINLFPLSFILIMGVRLRAHTIEKLQLERVLRLKNIEWEILMEKMQLIVVRTSMEGKLIYINSYGVKLLNYDQTSELLGRTWLDYFLPGQETQNAKDIFKKAVSEIESAPQFSNTIVTKDGEEKSVTWTTDVTFDNKGLVAGLIHFGLNTTDQDKAFKEVKYLKSEIRKRKSHAKMPVQKMET
jgi:PAS domain S-box-containing protein